MDTSPGPPPAVLVIAALIATVAYWLVIGTLALAQFWAICIPETQGCPTLLIMSARAIGVVALGIAGFGVSVWTVRRFQALTAYFAAAVLAAFLIFAIWLATLTFS